MLNAATMPAIGFRSAERGSSAAQPHVSHRHPSKVSDFANTIFRGMAIVSHRVSVEDAVFSTLAGCSASPQFLMFDRAVEGINSLKMVLKSTLIFGAQTHEFNSHANSWIARAH